MQKLTAAINLSLYFYFYYRKSRITVDKYLKADTVEMWLLNPLVCGFLVLNKHILDPKL